MSESPNYVFEVSTASKYGYHKAGHPVKDNVKDEDIKRWLKVGIIRRDDLQTDIETEGAAGITGTPLPEDFPGREELIEQGFVTVEQVSKLDQKSLIALSGIGDVTAKKIIKYLTK